MRWQKTIPPSERRTGYRIDFLHGFLFLSVALLFLSPALVYANTDYYRHVYFDNSLTPESYFYSRGNASAPSKLELAGSRLPVETKIFLTPPNALRLAWNSESGGAWEAEVHLVDFRNRLPELSGRNLYLWCFAPHAISAGGPPQPFFLFARAGRGGALVPGPLTLPASPGEFSRKIS